MLRTRSKLFDHWIIRIGAIGLAAMSATALVAHAQNQQVLPGQPGADHDRGRCRSTVRALFGPGREFQRHGYPKGGQSKNRHRVDEERGAGERRRDSVSPWQYGPMLFTTCRWIAAETSVVS